ncbi:MAG: MgtC/SapB family protein [Minisyncoccia bacterium]
MIITSNVLFLCSRDLLLAAALGALIGLERKHARKEAGMRTFALISLGASLFLIINRLSYTQYFLMTGSNPSQVLSQIIIGMGFLGAGVIIFHPTDNQVIGLTTAATMWATAAIGAAVGLRLYGIAIVSTILVMLINLIILPIERHLEKN